MKWSEQIPRVRCVKPGAEYYLLLSTDSYIYGKGTDTLL